MITYELRVRELELGFVFSIGWLLRLFAQSSPPTPASFVGDPSQLKLPRILHLDLFNYKENGKMEKLNRLN